MAHISRLFSLLLKDAVGCSIIEFHWDGAESMVYVNNKWSTTRFSFIQISGSIQIYFKMADASIIPVS